MLHNTQTVDVSGAASYPTTPQVTVPFTPRELLVIVEDATDDVFVSFDGTNDAAHMVPGFGSQALKFKEPGARVWFRRGTVVAPTMVQVISEGVA